FVSATRAPAACTLFPTRRSSDLGDTAAVVFDALPGQIFDARVTSLDAGTSQGQLLPDGSLASPESSDRWVRDAQRQRVHLTIQEDRKSTRLNSSHVKTSYAVFCL